MVEDRGPQLLGVASTFVATAFLATCLRIYTRIFIVRHVGLDDYFMISATLTYIMFATCAIAGIHYGTGRHFTDLTPDGITMAMRYWWLCYIAYCLTMIAAKLSVGVFLLRLTINKIHIWIIYGVMTITVITGVVFFFVTLFQCAPISYFWYRSQPGSCVDVEVIMGLTYLYGTLSAICDFTFGIQPIFLVWNLQMNRRTKILLCPIIGMACIASTAVLVRMAYIKDFKNPDFLYATVDIAIWSDTEQGLAITAGSLATLRPLLRQIKIKMGFSTSGPSNGNTPAGSKTPAYKKGSSRARRGPFSLITLTHAGDGDEYHRMGDIKTSSGEPPKDGSTWNVQERDRESEEELHHAKRYDIEAGFKSDPGSKW